jgi:hypothetical protein
LSRPDATAAAFLANPANKVLRPVHFIFMDFVGDILRANDSGITITVSGSSQPDLNGTYDGITGDVAEISPIQITDGGSSPVSCKLSGLPTIDDATLALINDQTKWKGRLVRIWRIIWNDIGVAQGVHQHLYTGYMVDLIWGGDPGTEDQAGSQWIEVTVENYLVAFAQASGRSYLNSKDYDPGDASGDLAVTAALGAGNSPGGRPVDEARSGFGGGGRYGGGHISKF